MAGDISSADESREGPSSEELVGGMYARQRRRRVLLVVGAIVAVVVGGVGLAFWQVVKAKQRAHQAYSGLCQCLFDGAPPEGEAPAAKYRRAQLGAMGLPEAQRGLIDKVPWPQRCGARAQEVFDAAKSAGMTAGGDKDLSYWADSLAKILRSPQGHVLDATEPLNAMFEQAKKEGLVYEKTSEPGPPVSPAPLNADDLVKLGPITKRPFSFARVSLDPIPGSERHLLVQDKDIPESPLLCSHSEAALTCRKLPDPMAKSPHPLTLGGTTAPGAAPLIFSGQRGASGVFRSDTGEELYAMFTTSSHVAADGSVVAIAEDGGGTAYLLSAKAGGKVTKRRLEIEGYDIGAPGRTTQILWDHVVFLGVKDSDGDEGDGKKNGKKKRGADDLDVAPEPREVHAHAAKLSADAATLGPIVDLGRVGSLHGTMPRAGEDPLVHGCQSSSGVVALAYMGNAYAMWLTDGKWTAPLGVTVLRGDIMCDAGGFGTAVFKPGSDAEPWDGSVSHARCTSAGCKSGRAAVKEMLSGGLELAPRNKLADAAPLGDDVVFVWAAGERGGVRARVGAVDKLSAANDIVVFDDLVKEGKLREKSIVTDLGILPGNGFATVVIATEIGVFAVRIKKDGTLEPVSVTTR